MRRSNLSAMAQPIDFESEGLLAGLSGEHRRSREALLERLVADGVELEDLREAVAQGRLAMLPVERVLAGEEAYTPREVADQSGVPLETLDKQWRALGMVVGDPDERTRTADDLEAARRVRQFLDAGLDTGGLLETARVMSMSMSQVAAANRQMTGEQFGEDGDGGEGELELAERLEALAVGLTPMIGPSLEHIYKLQLREQLRHVAIDAGSAEPGEDAGVERMAVAFADLVDFTRLGERLPPEEFGKITRRFSELAGEVAAGPVRLVKLIGDAAMLASGDEAALVSATLALVDLVDREDESFPALRAGAATGGVLPRGGDLYGRTVNLASRLTGVARPGSALVSKELAERLDGRFEFSDAGSKRLKGIKESVRIFRVRELERE